MRGTASFLLELMPVVFGLVFLVVVVGLGAVGGRSRLRLATMGLLGVWVALMGQRYVHQLLWRRGLAELTPERVQRLEVDGRGVGSPADVEAVVQCLRETEWFSANHGGWKRTVPLVVTLSDGTVRRYQVARYTREPGAVIAFVRPGSFGTWQDGYAFSAALPVALSAAGAPLP